MTCFGNILWLVFGGLFASLGYIIGGLAMCLTIIGIPFGVQSIKIGIANLAPFGKEVLEVGDPWSGLTVIFNILWAILFGWEITLIHLVSALILTITIIGIPFAKQHIKLVPLALFPFGRDLGIAAPRSSSSALTTA